MIRILTEDINRSNIHDALASASVDAYTLIPCEGCWKDVQEKSLIIELDGITRFRAECIAERIRYANEQQAVLVQEIPSTSTLITGDSHTNRCTPAEWERENDGILKFIGIHPTQVYSD